MKREILEIIDKSIEKPKVICGYDILNEFLALLEPEEVMELGEWTIKIWSWRGSGTFECNYTERSITIEKDGVQVMALNEAEGKKFLNVFKRIDMYMYAARETESSIRRHQAHTSLYKTWLRECGVR